MPVLIGEVVHANHGDIDWVVVEANTTHLTLVPLAHAAPTAWKHSPWILMVPLSRQHEMLSPCNPDCKRVN